MHEIKSNKSKNEKIESLFKWLKNATFVGKREDQQIFI
jgi:hypothetical protein